jgi:predicted nucleotidyltransferase
MRGFPAEQCGKYFVSDAMASVDSTLLNEIIKRVLGVAQPELIIVFGSAASDRMTKDSDIDLLVVEASLPDPLQRSVVIRRALSGLGFPFDVVVMSSERFGQTKDIIGGIAYPANKYGKVIYEAA